MFWEEKIEILKKHLSQKDFRILFTEWPDILKQIESKFIIKQNSLYHFTNWSDNIKNKTLIRAIPIPLLFDEINKLDSNINYWMVIVSDSSPTSKHLVYDCKVIAIGKLISIIKGDFYIIDKKYNWFAFFNLDTENDELRIFKSSPGITPFDI